MTPAEELRAAAKVLRCDHRFPVQPPEGTFFKPGPCRLCGTPYSEDRIPEALVESLAALLDQLADWWTAFDIQPEHDHPALATARAVNPPAEAEEATR